MDPQATALGIKETLATIGVPSFIERSGSAKGYHVWIFLDGAVSAAVARRFGLLIAGCVNPPLADGTPADARANRGLEIFPKSVNAPQEGKVGSMIYVPFFGAPIEGGSRFYRPTELGTLEPYEPVSFDRAPVAKLKAFLQSVAAPTAVSSAPAPTAVAGGKNGQDDPFKNWKQQALANLDLHAIYGEFLTGSSVNGYLTCRDPSSPSGDRTPSAGVADTTSEVDRGTFHSFRDGRTLSVFDFLVETGKAKSFLEAAHQVATLIGIPFPASPGKSFWRQFDDAKMVECCVPLLDARFVLLRDADGTERTYAVNDRREVALLSNERPLEQALYDCLKQRYGEIPPENLIRRSIELWRRETKRLTMEPLPFAFKGDEYTFQRFDWEPEPGATPAWDEFVDRTSDPTAFLAFVWSIFEPRNQSRQYCWLQGDGQDGKSVVLGVLHETVGKAATAINNNQLKCANQFLNSALYGKRLVTYPDCKDSKFGMREYVRNWTSGDAVPIEIKHGPIFSAPLRVKLLIASNPRPELSSQAADVSRMIYIEVAPSETKDDPTWGERLCAELPHFLWRCRAVYEDVCPHHGNIPLAESTKRLIAETAMSFEDEFYDIFEAHFEVAPGESVPAREVAEILRSKRLDNNRIADFKQFAMRCFNVGYKSTKSGRVYIGVRMKPRPIKYFIG
jgi:hypothetical protein